MRRSMSNVTVLVFALLAAPSALADVITIQARKDNTLYQDVAGSLSNGAGPNLFVGKSGAGVVRRGLLAFDIVSHIQSGSKVNGVLLTLHMSRTTSGPQAVSLQRVLADWGEGTSVAGGGGGGGGPATPNDATWLHTFYDTDLWAAAGGDFETAASAATDVNGVGFYTWGSTPQMVADVQTWIDNPASDFGWAILGNEVPPSKTSKKFDSRENPTWVFRPTLTLHFTPPIGCSGPLKADLNKDCKVNFRDFAIVAAEWLEDKTLTQDQGTILINGVGEFTFDPPQVQTVRPDIFKQGHFSVFDVLVHLGQKGSIDMEYHFDPNANTHVIDSINSAADWWYAAHYDGGWDEDNVFRMDHYPYKDRMYIEVKQTDPNHLANVYAAFADEMARKQLNGGQVIIPHVLITDCNGIVSDFYDVVVEPHNLRDDTFQQGITTAIDVILSLADQGTISYDLQWYDSIGSAGIVRSYWVERIDQCQASGSCGFVYAEGTVGFGLLNHIHIPSDYRVINSPEYETWFWLELGPCN